MRRRELAAATARLGLHRLGVDLDTCKSKIRQHEPFSQLGGDGDILDWRENMLKSVSRRAGGREEVEKSSRSDPDNFTVILSTRRDCWIVRMAGQPRTGGCEERQVSK